MPPATPRRPPTRTFTFDTTAPQTTIDTSPTDPTASTSASFDLSSSEGGSTFECRIDGGAWGTCTSPRNYTTLSDGSHTFDVRATDVAGNTDATPASYIWLVDTTAPSSTIAFPTAAATYSSAGWNAGCPTSGLCGTYSDGAGSGVADVEVSIRQGSGELLERHRLRQRHRSLERRHHDGRQLVAGLPRRKLPRRR